MRVWQHGAGRSGQAEKDEGGKGGVEKNGKGEKGRVEKAWVTLTSATWARRPVKYQNRNQYRNFLHDPAAPVPVPAPAVAPAPAPAAPAAPAPADL